MFQDLANYLGMGVEEMIVYGILLTALFVFIIIILVSRQTRVFFTESFQELDHVVWPTKEETKRYFITVVLMITVIGIFLYVVGYAFFISTYFAREAIQGDSSQTKTEEVNVVSTKDSLQFDTDSIQIDTNGEGKLKINPVVNTRAEAETEVEKDSENISKEKNGETGESKKTEEKSENTSETINSTNAQTEIIPENIAEETGEAREVSEEPKVSETEASETVQSIQPESGVQVSSGENTTNTVE